MSYKIRKFEEKDAEVVSEIIRRNFMEINIKDYSYEEMQKLSEVYNANKVTEIAGYSHMYVVLDKDNIIGTGSIARFWGSLDESILLTIFVSPDYHKKGVGRLIMDTLEKDDLFLTSKRIEIPASITAQKFYAKFGYDFKDCLKILDDEGHYRMGKFRKLVERT